MNKEAIYHRSDSSYCFATDEKHVTLRLRVMRGEKISATVEYNNKYDFNVVRLDAEMEKGFSDALYDYYVAYLTLSDVRLAYVFRIQTEDGRVYIYSEDGLTENYDYNLGYYSFFQIAYVNKTDVHSRVEWMANAVFYQIFVDRFNKGKQLKDTAYINTEWSALPTPKSFTGGDLYGIAEKLDYIQELGVNALYLTPVFCSVSNHKYDTYDYYNVDPMFGGNEALRSLVEKAHERGIKVVLDAVFNHSSDALMQFKDVVEKGRKSRYYKWFNINGEKPVKKPLNYECFGAVDYMPKFNTSNAEVRRFLCDIGVYWIKAYGIDGWRLDVSDEVSHGFWREFALAVKNEKKDAVLIGENWHDASSYLKGDQFDSIMNYRFTKTVLDMLKADSGAATVSDRLNNLLMRYSDNVNYMMFNLLDCHDTHRIYQEAGFNRDKVLAAVALEIFYPGAANVYYGTEILTAGGYDPDSRRTFDWDKVGAPDVSRFTEDVKTLLALKKTKDLGTGSVKIYAEKNCVVICRGSYKLVLNLGESAAVEGKPFILRCNDGALLKKFGFAIYKYFKGETL